MITMSMMRRLSPLSNDRAVACAYLHAVPQRVQTAVGDGCTVVFGFGGFAGFRWDDFVAPRVSLRHGESADLSTCHLLPMHVYSLSTHTR